MKQNLQLKLSQSLKLTPQLQQSIRLLQLSSIELQAELEQALNDNPMLERTEEESGPAEPSKDSESNSDKPTPEPQTNQDKLGSIDENWPTDWRDYSSQTSDDFEDRPEFQLASPESGLQNHLIEQLRLTAASEKDCNLVLWLIDYIDDDGYLSISLEELWATLQSTPELEFDELKSALSLLQSFDPAGVGARNASECLSLQLKDNQAHIEPEVFITSLELVTNHLTLLASRDHTKIKKALGINDALLKRCNQVIQSLLPYPGNRFRVVKDDHTQPDVLVQKKNGKWVALLNPELAPKLRINEVYASILRSETKQAGQLSAQLQEARWLIRNIQQRFETILRVSQAIVDHQHAYFDQGVMAMKPLVLREIADPLGLHESTVSRVTTQKYILTPYGLVELKYFFGSHVSTESGGQASSTAIRALIKQIVATEDSKKPLSDNKISTLLSEQGIVIARRTVAKYRESLKIPPVNMRKSL